MVPHHVIQVIMSEGLAQGLYRVVRVGFKPATLRTQGTELTTEPPCPKGHVPLLVAVIFILAMTNVFCLLGEWSNFHK